MKLLVTTDFSTNSKGAIRFAHTLAKQSNATEVVFYYSVHIMKPTLWSDSFFGKYKHEEIERLTADLQKFVYSTIGNDKEDFLKIDFVVDDTNSTEKEIISYAEKNNIDYICIATQGAGVLRKVLGTHTKYIINHSKIPVLVIPSHYRSKTLNKAIYLSDFENVQNDLTRLLPFTNSSKLSLEALHYSSIITDQQKFETNKALFETEEYKEIKLNIIKNNLELPIVEKVSNYVSKSKPELLVMFTKKERGFFESIFLPSISEELTFSTKVPVLIFSK